MMITGGINVFPAEIETVLRALPGVAEAAVFGLPDPHWGELVCAVIQERRDPGAPRLTRAAVQAQCRALLPRPKWPRRLYLIREFPMTASGKIARAELRRRVIEGDGALTGLP